MVEFASRSSAEAAINSKGLFYNDTKLEMQIFDNPAPKTNKPNDENKMDIQNDEALPPNHAIESGNLADEDVLVTI